jgi:hypothetical protein
MIYDIICFKLIFLNKLNKNRLRNLRVNLIKFMGKFKFLRANQIKSNLRVSSRFCGGKIQEFAGEFRLRVSSSNLQANLINFAG